MLLQVIIKLATYCAAQSRACQMLAEIQQHGDTDDVDNIDSRFDVKLAKESIQKMLDSVNLNFKEYTAFDIVGVNIGSDNVVSDRVSIRDTCLQILKGIKNSYTFEFSGVMATSQYNSKFSMTTDFELASLNSARDIINGSTEASGRNARQRDSYFHGSFCDICKRRYKNITLRNSLRKHICRSCGLSCCSTCCSAKILDDRTGTYVDVCTQCAFT
jgi:hypothetical protein